MLIIRCLCFMYQKSFVWKMRKVCGNIPRKVGECKIPLLQHTHTASLKNSAFMVSNSSK